MCVVCVSERKGVREEGRQLAKAEKVKASFGGLFCCAGLEVRLCIFEELGRAKTPLSSDHNTNEAHIHWHTAKVIWARGLSCHFYTQLR